jgi:O-antigen ligase
VDRPSPRQAGARTAAQSRPGSFTVLGTDAAAVPYRFTSICAAATCALTPAYTVRWHVGPVPTTVLENAILVTIAVFLFEMVRHRTQLVWRTPMLVPAALFLIAGAISVVVAPDHRAAIGLYRAYFIEPMAFAFVLINVVTTPWRALTIAGGLAAGGVVAGLANSVVIVQALRHHTYDVVNTPPVVIYNTANAVALFLVPVVAFAGAIALHWEERRVRWVAAAVGALGTLCVVLSFSRGGYLALAAVVVGLALSYRRRWIVLGAGVVVAAGLMLVSSIRHRVLTELDFTNGSNTLVGRFHLWSVALQMLRDHPIFGAGLSGFATVIAPYWNPTNADRFTYPHNIVLNSWTETGVLGVVAFAWILVVGFRSSWRGWRASSAAWRAVHLGVLLALIAVVVHGLVDVPYWKNDLSLELWALLSLTLAATALPGIAPKASP